MAWTLDIHLIDVGQGESTFVVAQDPTIPNGLWTMLIDSGHPVYAPTVNAYIQALGLPVHTIVASHYDGDHSGGVGALLVADNLFRVCQTIAAVVTGIGAAGARPVQIAGFTAAACAAVMGGYGASVGGANAAATAARLGAEPNMTDAQASAFGIQSAEDLPPAAPQPLFAQTTNKRRDIARIVGLAAANAGTVGGNVAQAALGAALQTMYPTVRAGSRFSTEGLYANTRVVDIGAAANQPAGWAAAIAGGYTASGNYFVQAPNLNRPRIGPPPLGSEVLSTGLVGVAPRTANAPAAYVVAVNQTTWPGGAVFPGSGQPSNDASIGLIFRFNDFFYWTAGDLPSQGENVVGAAVMANGLPNPAGGAFPAASRIASFKCGHHGSQGSTSGPFLTAVQPAGAMISAGANPAYQHPDQNVITRLSGNANVVFYYLTNCNYPRVGVPASQAPPQPQLPPPNKSRISGDNVVPNRNPGRSRGNVHLSIAEVLSTAPAGLRHYGVSYWEMGLIPPGPRAEATPF